MLEECVEQYLFCDLCSNDKFNTKRYKLKLKHGGYICICENCLKKLQSSEFMF